MKPALTILAGGPDTYNEGPSLLAQNPELDFVIDRDGELPFRLLLQHLLATPTARAVGPSFESRAVSSEVNVAGRPASQPSDLNNIPWLSFRAGGTTRMSSARTIITNLDEIPSPVIGGSRSDLLTRFYKEDFSAIVLETSRGCPVNCKFCQYPKAGSGTWRYFSLDRVLEELRYIKDLDINEVYFADGIFTLDKQRAAAILDFFINEMPQARLQVEVKLDILPDLLVQPFRTLLDQERLRFGVGIQSVNESTLETIGRPTNLRKLKENVHKLTTDRPRTMRWDLIYGLPGDTIQDLVAGMDFITETAPDGRTAIQALHVLPGTEVRSHAVEMGLVYDTRAPYNVLKTATFSSRDVRVAGILSSLIDAFAPALSVAFRKDRLALSIPSPFQRIFDSSFLETVYREGSLTSALQLQFIERFVALLPAETGSNDLRNFLRETFEHVFIVRNAGSRGWRHGAGMLKSYRGQAIAPKVTIFDDTLLRHTRLLDAIDKFRFEYEVSSWLDGSTSGGSPGFLPRPNPYWYLIAGGQIQRLSDTTYDLLERLRGPVTVEKALAGLFSDNGSSSSATTSEISSMLAEFVDDGLITVCSREDM